MKLSPHFTLAELCRSQTAAREGIDNTPPPEVVARLRVLCERVLEPVRALVGAPVFVSSGYRSPALNRRVSGTENGQHPKGEAVDFEVPGVDNLALAHKIVASDIDFDQLILEFYVDGQPSSGWLHVSYREGRNRGDVLTAYAEGKGRTRYAKGLPQLPQG